MFSGKKVKENLLREKKNTSMFPDRGKVIAMKNSKYTMPWRDVSLKKRSKRVCMHGGVHKMDHNV